MPHSDDSSLWVYAIGLTGALTPFALSTTSFETEAGKPATFTLSDSFTLANNSTGINPPTERVILRIGRFSVTIPAGKFTQLTDGTFSFEGSQGRVEESACPWRRGRRFQLLMNRQPPQEMTN